MLALVNKIKRSNTHLNLDQLKFYVQSYKESFITFSLCSNWTAREEHKQLQNKAAYQETQKQEGALGLESVSLF